MDELDKLVDALNEVDLADRSQNESERKFERGGGRVLIYGSYGFFGELISKRACQAGLNVVLSGRQLQRCQTIARNLGLNAEKNIACFELIDQETVVTALEQLTDVSLVLNCASPFSASFPILSEACILTQKHYIDISGDIDVFEAAYKLDDRARQAGVIIMPGCGFDVVASDCLALRLKNKLPSATKLELAFYGTRSSVSNGVASPLSCEELPEKNLVRRNGEIVEEDYHTKQVVFRDNRISSYHSININTISIPWGDISSAYHSTGIPNITVYVGVPGVASWMTWLGGFSLTKAVLGGSVLPSLATDWVSPANPPTPTELEWGQSFVWGEAIDEKSDERVESRLTTREMHLCTAMCAVGVMKKIIALDMETLRTDPETQEESAGCFRLKGFQTPATAFGADFITEIENSQAVFKDVQHPHTTAAAGEMGGAVSQRSLLDRILLL